MKPQPRGTGCVNCARPDQWGASSGLRAGRPYPGSNVIKQGKPGQYRVSLLKTFKDGFYSGLHLLPDGTIVATTYANYRQEDVGCSIVSVRFKMSEIDAMAAKPRKQP